MNTIKKQYNTVVLQASKGVPGFANAYAKFFEKVIINQSSQVLIVNYSRSVAYLNELLRLRLQGLDLRRMQVLVRLGIGSNDRYTSFSNYLLLNQDNSSILRIEILFIFINVLLAVY